MCGLRRDVERGFRRSVCGGFAPTPPVSPPTAREAGAAYGLFLLPCLERGVASSPSRSSRYAVAAQTLTAFQLPRIPRFHVQKQRPP